MTRGKQLQLDLGDAPASTCAPARRRDSAPKASGPVTHLARTLDRTLCGLRYTDVTLTALSVEQLHASDNPCGACRRRAAPRSKKGHVP